MDTEKYKIDSIEKCEYIDAMRKVYCKDPEKADGYCGGYHNKYTGVVSAVCADCGYYKEGIRQHDIQ